MRNDIVVCNEFGRKIAYCKINGQIYRREIYNLNDLLRKLGLISYEEGIKSGIIREVSENNNKLQEYRSLLVQQQLDGNFINNLTNPIDDDVICKEFFEQLVSTDIPNPFCPLRNIRLKSDKPVDYKPPQNILLTEAKLFSTLLNNFDYLKDSSKKLKLSNQGMQQLMLHANDLDYLQKILKLFLDFEQRNEDVTFNKRMDNAITAEKYGSIYPELFSFSYEDMSKLYEFYDGLIDLYNEHISPQKYTLDYDARLYFNIHDEEVMSQFLHIYISQCIKQNIPYNIKGLRATSVVGVCDTTVFYTNFHDLKLHIKIIENILLEHPEWRKSFEQPVYPASRFGTGFYGVTHAGGYNDEKLQETYNSYYEYNFRLAFYCMLAKVLIENNLIKPTYDCWKLVNMLYKFKDLNIDSKSSAVKLITTNDNKSILSSATILLKKYITPQMNQKILSLGHDAFRDYVYKIHALCQHLRPGTRMNLSINSEMNDFFIKTKTASSEETNVSLKKKNISLSEKKVFLMKCQTIIEAAKHPELYSAGINITLSKLADRIRKECLGDSSLNEFNEAYLDIEKSIDIILKKIKKENIEIDVLDNHEDYLNKGLEESIRYLTSEIRKRYHSTSAEGRYNELIPVLHRCVHDFSSILSSNINNDLEIILREIISCHDNYVSAFNTGSWKKEYYLNQLKVAIIKLEKSINNVFDHNTRKY